MENHLLVQIQMLQTENQRLRTRLSKYETVEQEEMKLTKQDKLEIFKTYFHGREDVVAIRYFDKKRQRFGYTPLCKNDFKKGVCPKGNGQKLNCLLCPNRDFVPYTTELLFEHVTPKNSHQEYKDKEICLGIYPLLDDHTTYFLAIDFDDGGWMDEMRCVYHIAQRYGLDPVMERSQSGHGGHLWLFFMEAILASKARKLGMFLLKQAMQECKTIQISSFDRMFPNQDCIPKGGIGNLIALPLHYQSFQVGNSTFINEHGLKINKPFHYLTKIRRSTAQEIEQLLAMDQQKDYFFDGVQIALEFGMQMKYNDRLEVIETSMLHIRKLNCNAATLNMIRRLASMSNPEYYMKLRMHMPIYQTPSALCEYIETDAYLSVPRGCKEKLYQIFPNTEIVIQDRRIHGTAITVEFNGVLLEDQLPAIQTLLKFDMGVLHAVAGFGKTVMAIYVIAQKKCSTLIIVPTKELKKQWMERIDEFLIYPKSEKKRNAYIGEYSGNKKNLKGMLDIATIQSLSKNDNLDQLLSSYGMVIIDECHHIPANSFRTVLRHAKSKYLYGFSATPDRSDGLEKMLYMYCGPKRYETNKKTIIAKRTFSQILIPHFTNVRFIEQKDTYHEIINELYINKHRNFMIINDIITEYRLGRKCIVLSERMEHLYLLYERIRDVSNHIFVLTSEMKAAKRKQIMEELRSVSMQGPYIVLATSKLLGEGFDLPSLDTLFLTLPISDKNRIAQYTGRIHRQMIGKQHVYVHDYIDIHIPMMENMFQKRIKAYQSEGYVTQTKQPTEITTQYVFQEATYLHTLQRDFEFANKRIIVVTPSLRFGKIKQHFKMIQNACMRGITVTFYLPEGTSSDARAFIEGTGSNILKPSIKKVVNIIIIDQALIWYGDFNVFGKVKKETTLVRLENQMLVEEIIEEIIS